MSEKISTEQSVMHKITHQEITMKPQWYFAVGSILSIFGVLGLIIAAITLLNIVFYSTFSQGKHADMHATALLSTFPWWTLILALMAAWGGYTLLKRYEFSYKANATALIAAFVGLLCIGAYIVDKTGVNSRWEARGPMRGLYGMHGNMNGYRGNGNSSNDDVYMGRDNRGRGEGRGMMDGYIPSTPSTTPTQALTADAKNALLRALDDEYRAYALYEKVLTTFGGVRPFSNIIRAEEYHIQLVSDLLQTYGVPVPNNTYIGTLQAPTSIATACAAGIQAEQANAKLYTENLLPEVTEYADITAVFHELLQASQQNHLPAFERCNTTQ